MFAGSAESGLGAYEDLHNMRQHTRRIGTGEWGSIKDEESLH